MISISSATVWDGVSTMFTLVVEIPDCRGPEKSPILKILTTNENQTLSLTIGQRALVDNEGELSNCFSINQLVLHNIILKKRTETSAKHEFSAIVLNLKIDSFCWLSNCLSLIDSE